MTRHFRLQPRDGLGIVTAFLRRHLPDTEALRSDGSITLDVEVRAVSLGLRWKRMLRWVPGDDLEELLRQASQRWTDWPKEIHHDRDEEELELGDAFLKLPGVGPRKP